MITQSHLMFDGYVKNVTKNGIKITNQFMSKVPF